MANRNPSWTPNELILALNLYFKHRKHLPSKAHPDIVELSQLLKDLDPICAQKWPSYRSPGAVYAKLNNFRRFDIGYLSAGRVGLLHGGAHDGYIWAEYAADPKKLEKAAVAIIANSVIAK